MVGDDVERSHHFLVRVGANVSLLTEMADCSLDKGKMIVMSWPQEAMKAGKPPLRLRLVKVRVGKTWMWLLRSASRTLQLNQQPGSRDRKKKPDILEMTGL